MSKWEILPQEMDSAMVSYSQNQEKGPQTTWHGDTIGYLKQVYNKTTFRGCVDAGASYGFLSVPFSFMFEKVYSFEPNPDVVGCLRQNIEFRDNITVYSQALSNVDGSFYLEIPSEITGMGKLHLEEPKIDNKLYSIKTITLDSLDLKEIDFIKIDVEGHELKLIQGAEQTIKKWRPVIYCEIHSQRTIENYKYRREIFDFFDSLNYKLFDVRYHDYIFLPL